MNKDICYLRPKINKNNKLNRENEQFKSMTKRNHSVNYNKQLNKNTQLNTSLETFSIYDKKDNSSLSSMSNNYLLSSYNADNNKRLNNESQYLKGFSPFNAQNLTPFISQRSSISNRKISEMKAYTNKLESMVNYYTDLITSIKTTLVSSLFNFIKLKEYCS